MFTLGQRIRSKRKQQKIAVEELAEYIGVTRQTVANWEADKSEPTMMNFTQLCNIFGVSMEYFVGSDSEMKAIEEIAATKSEPQMHKKQKVYLILAIVATVLFVLMAIVISCMSVMVFSDARSGGDYVTTAPIGISEFILVSIIATILAAGAAIFYVFYYRAKHKSYVK